MQEYIRTLSEEARVKVPIGACRFFASVQHITNEEHAKDYIGKVSSEFKDATHNAWGYKITDAKETITRYSDDREPASTAGPPILQAIDSAQVTNVVVVVTRYYGGVKLGVGGLIRAYRQAAAAGLAAAGVRELPVLCKIVVSGLSYTVLGIVLHELESSKATVKAVEHGLSVSVRADAFPSTVEVIRARVIELTRGQGDVVIVE